MFDFGSFVFGINCGIILCICIFALMDSIRKKKLRKKESEVKEDEV